MLKINENYSLLKESYLFSETGRRIREYSTAHPDKKVIKLSIGDVTQPLTKTVIEAMHKAVDEMGCADTFRGYAPEYGYDFLREAVSRYYKRNAVTVKPSEIFISDGAKSDVGNILDIFGDNTALIPDPVYPVYLDSNIMSGRSVRFLAATAECGFLPMPDGLGEESLIIYLCSPNNPTGAVYDRGQLKAWVDFANSTGSVIIFDSAYEAYISGALPHSIYEIDGARSCAVEICSFSKSFGFTGTRCAWSVYPDELEIGGKKLAKLWARRQATKYNGVPYIIQRAAEAALTDRGIAENRETVAYYMGNASLIADCLREKGIYFTGGVSSPYIWHKCPGNMSSWEYFDFLLDRLQIAGTPGAGFGSNGEGYFRLTSFSSRESTLEAVERIRLGL